MTDPTAYSVRDRVAKRSRKGEKRSKPILAPLDADLRMGRTTAFRDDRARWHILTDAGASLCGRQPKIDETAAYSSVSGQLICQNCHAKFSWSPMPRDTHEEDRGYETACWVWSRGRTGRGYSTRVVPGTGRTVAVPHREAYEAAYGAIPEGLIIHHKCGQKDCLRPDHLQAVTRLEHIAIHHRKLDYDEIARLYRAGQGPNVIAIQLEAKRSTVKAAIARMKKRGDL